MPQKPEFVICHYSEIGLKGKNRKFFEEKLIENIKKALGRAFYKKVSRISGRILVEIGEGADKKEIKDKLRLIFGIAYFALAQDCKQNIEAIKQKAVEMLQGQEFETFKISTQRSEKKFPLTSQQVNEQVGTYILERSERSEVPCKQGASLLPGLRVDLEKPDITLFIEIVEKYAFLYTEKIAGLGGLPVGVSGKAVSLLSGGIDSPVASFYAQKRGIKLIFVHFHALPYVNRASIDKVKKIIKVLNKYQFTSTLYLVPFSDIQKEILLKTKAKLRVVLYRRFMLRIAGVIAQKEKARALVTGESVGQVASQTLENITAIEEAVGLPVLRPLICQDKQEIIEKAKQISTFEISILPHQDCCARFLPKHPATKSNLREVKSEEAKLDVAKLIKNTIQRSEKIMINY